MNDSVLKVKRKSENTNQQKVFSVGYHNHFLFNRHIDYKNKKIYLSLNVLSSQNDNMGNPAVIVDVTNVSTKEFNALYQDFKMNVDMETNKIFKEKDYININSRTLKCLDASLYKLKDKIRLINKNERFYIKREKVDYKQNNQAEEMGKVNRLMPAFLLETLAIKGHIQIIDKEINGSDEQIYNFSSNTTGQTYKVSVKSIEYLMADNNINEQDNSVYKHFRPLTNGGRGSINLLLNLIDDGLNVGVEIDKENNKVKYAQARRFIYEELIPEVSNESLAEARSYNSTNNIFRELKVSNYPRLPNKVHNQEEENKFKRYFMNRGLSGELFDKMVEKEAFYIGNFYKDNIKNQAGGIVDYENLGFFDITNKDWVKVGAEKLTLLYNKDNNSYDKIHKVSTHSIQGNSFKFNPDPNNNSRKDGVIIGEAVIDAVSSYEILKMGGIDPNRYTYASIQGINNFKGFLRENFGINYTSIDRKEKNYNYSFSTVQHFTQELTQGEIDRVKNTFKSKLFFVNDLSINNTLELNKFNKFIEIFGLEGSVINVENKLSKIYKPEGEAACYIDETSINHLLLNNGVLIDNQLNVKAYRQKQIDEELTPENVKLAKEKIQQVFGTEKVIFVFDNDRAGQMDIKVIYDLKEKYGFDFVDMTPQKYGNRYEPDVNDVLKDIVKDRNSAASQSLIENFIKPIKQTEKLEVKNNANYKNKM